MRSKRESIPILMYHSISRFAHPRFAKFVVSPELFAEHMAYLDEQGYTPITVTQLTQAMASDGAALPARPIVLTVDDGFADFYSNALPLLERHAFVATLYVVTGYIGGTSAWLRREGEADRPMLSWDELQEIGQRGIECGAHTHTHRPLDTIERAAAHDEIVRSKSTLEDHLGRRVASFAYPYGFYTAPVRTLVRQAGFTSACAVRYTSSSLADDAYALARLIVTAHTDIPALAALLAGRHPPGLTQARHARTRVWWFVRSGKARLQRLVGEGG